MSIFDDIIDRALGDSPGLASDDADDEVRAYPAPDGTLSLTNGDAYLKSDRAVTLEDVR